MRVAFLSVLACIAPLISCSQDPPDRGTISTTSYSDSAFRADSTRLAAILLRDSTEREEALRVRRSSKYGAPTGDYVPPPVTSVDRGVTVTAARADPVAADNGSPPDDSTRAARAGVRGLKAPQVAQHLRGMKGRVAVAILYGTHCPRSQAMFPGFVALSEAHQSDPVQFAAIETDRYPEDLRGFLGSFRAPFDPLFYVHRQRGELDAALREFGVNLPATFNMPYVAVLDPDGNVIDQWDAATNLAAIDGAIRQGLAR